MCTANPGGETVGTSGAAIDDSENTTPAKWWIYTAQSAAEVNATIAKLDARIVDIKVDNLSPYPFTVTYVSNTGAYGKGALGTGWWWYPDIDYATLQNNISAHNGRLIALKAYDTGCQTIVCPNGSVRYTAVMIANTGADEKKWGFQVGKSVAEIDAYAQVNDARVTTVESYVSNGQFYYAAIFIQNTRADRKEWTWFHGATPASLSAYLRDGRMRLIDLTYTGGGDYNAAAEACNEGSCPAWGWWFDQTYAQTVSLAQTNNLRILTADTHPGCGDTCFDTIMVGGSLGTDPGTATTKLRGFVDLHTHPLSSLGFGGKLVYGGVDVGSTLPADPNCARDAVATSIENALGHDGSTHGGYNAFSNHCGDDLREIVIHGLQSGQGRNDPAGDSTGADDFSSWPTSNDITHQRMWVDWVRRSYQNGQRVMVALAVNNKTLGDSTAGPGDWKTDDKSNADREIEATKEFIARHGPGTRDYFMDVAYSSADVQRIVAANKMAVVLGIEVDAIGNFYKSASEDDIVQEVDRLYDEGVRYIFPIHILDNAFGGTALYEPSFDWSNNRESSGWWDVTCSNPGDGINYNMVNDLKNTNEVALAASEALKLHDLLDPSLASTVTPLTYLAIPIGVLVNDFAGALQKPPTPPSCNFDGGAGPVTGDVNSKGLTASGHIAIREMMKRGMLIDVDHMSKKSMDSALQDGLTPPPGVAPYPYPMISGHANILEGGGTERNPSADEYAKVGALHGMAGIGSQDLSAARWSRLAVDTVSAMGGRTGVAFGTDTDGLAAGMPATVPRVNSGATPASMFSHELGTACIINCEHDEQHAFYRDVLGAIVHVYYDNGGASFLGNTHRTTETWGGTPSAVVNTPPAIGNPTTMFTNGMQQHIFFRDNTNAIQHVFWDPKKGMTQEVWAQGAGTSTMGPAAGGDPAALYDPSNNQQHIFYADRSGNLQHVFWDGSMHAESWGTNAVGTPATMFSHETGFACIHNCAHNQQHVFYRDTSGRIMHVYYDEHDKSRTGPAPWAGTGSPHDAPAAAGDPATLFTPNQQQHMFYRDVNGAIQEVYWDNHAKSMNLAEPWATDAVGNPGVLFTHETGFACVTNCAHDQEHVFFRNAGNVMVHSYWDYSSNSRSAPEAWAQAVGGDPSAIMSTNMQQHIFFPDAEGNLMHVFWDPNGGGLQPPELWAGATADDYTPPIQYGSSLERSSQDMGSVGKTWDYNYQGVVHYGMLPDFLQAVQEAPTGRDLVNNNVMWGAQWFIDMWQAAENQICAPPSTTASCEGCPVTRRGGCQPNGCESGDYCNTQTNVCSSAATCVPLGTSFRGGAGSGAAGNCADPNTSTTSCAGKCAHAPCQANGCSDGDYCDTQTGLCDPPGTVCALSAGSVTCADPNTQAACTACVAAGEPCQTNGCYGGQYCSAQTGTCYPTNTCN
jgi:microsomal dipeptidase-like Zn-dependent dipeptidase/catechol 2,3-dioxygenase-like lactoylglutathione lyase family enzyme